MIPGSTLITSDSKNGPVYQDPKGVQYFLFGGKPVPTGTQVAKSHGSASSGASGLYTMPAGQGDLGPSLQEQLGYTDPFDTISKGVSNAAKYATDFYEAVSGAFGRTADFGRGVYELGRARVPLTLRKAVRNYRYRARRFNTRFSRFITDHGIPRFLMNYLDVPFVPRPGQGRAFRNYRKFRRRFKYAVGGFPYHFSRRPQNRGVGKRRRRNYRVVD